MTLIISALLRDAVVQVSDRRVSWHDGRVESDCDNKAICVACADAHFGIAYTGLARVGRQPTDELLFESLSNLPIGRLPLEEVLKFLGAVLADRLGRLTQIGQHYKGLELSLAGFHREMPIAGVLSNIRDAEGAKINARESFRYSLLGRTGRVSYTHLFVNGNSEALRRLLGGACRRRLTRELYSAPPDVATRLLAALIRAAGSRPQGHNIGRDCMATVVLPSRLFSTFYLPDRSGAVEYAPMCVFPSGAFLFETYLGDSEESVSDAAQYGKISEFLRRRERT